MVIFTPSLMDLIVFGVVIEFLVLAAILLRLRLKRLVLPLFLFLASGGALMVAMRFGLSETQAGLVAIPMLAALFLHTSFLVVAYRRFGPGRTGAPLTDPSLGNRPST